MINEFEKYLKQSDNLRPQFSESLLPVSKDWEKELLKNMNEIPEFFKIIYSKVAGTKYQITNQSLMDFTPGYFLVHIGEFGKNFVDLMTILRGYNHNEIFIPILRNYSSDFIAYKKDSNEIYLVLHDDFEIQLIHENPLDFLVTLNNNYEEKVYFLDDDGFLDYDADKEYEVARIYNPEIEYWLE